MRGMCMDFLEGFLLGPIWSDTEYEQRRHTGLYWFIGWLLLAAFAIMVFFPDKAPSWINMPRFLPILLFLVLAIGSPFACRYYYQLNIFLKIGILLVQAAKYGFGLLALFQYFMPRIKLDPATLPQDALEYFNVTMAKTTDYFEGMGKALGMLVGIVSGGILIVLTFVFYLLAATIIPAVYLFILKIIQRGIDLLAKKLLLKDSD